MQLDPISIKPFFNAYKLKIKEQNALSNIDAWRNGLYIREAIVSCFNEKSKYPEQPHDLTAKEEMQSEDGAINTDAIKFSAWTKMFNQNFTKQQPIATEPQ